MALWQQALCINVQSSCERGPLAGCDCRDGALAAPPGKVKGQWHYTPNIMNGSTRETRTHLTSPAGPRANTR
eukprot:scaffold262484_cov18-Prasinocladus_malaysianus.AAC.1